MATHYDPEYEYENRAWNSNVILVLYFRNYQEILNASFPSWPSFTQEEADAVQRVLLANKVNYWTGQESREFEREFAAYAGYRHANTHQRHSGSGSCPQGAQGVGPGDEVVVTPRTLFCSVSCIVTAGATPVSADVDPVTQNLSAQTIEPLLTEKAKAVVVVHLAGRPADLYPIMSLAESRSFKVIED